MPNPVYLVAVEFDTGSYTDVTSDCLRLSWGRSLSTYERAFSDGVAELIMDNETRRWTLTNSISPYYPYLKPHKAIRIQATHSGSTYNLFNGRIDSIKLDPKFGNRIAYMRASDRIETLKRQDIDQTFEVNYNVSSLFTDVLSALGVASGEMIVDTLFDTLPFVWFGKRGGVGVLNELLRYGNYKGFVDGSGNMNIRGRHYNVEGAPISSLNEFKDFNSEIDKETIYNVIRVQGDSPRKVSTTIQTIAWLTETVDIAAGGDVSFWLDYVDPITLEQRTPANSVATPVASTDFTMNTQSDGAGSDLTTSCSVYAGLFDKTAVFSIHNGSANVAYITKFNLRGFPVQAQPNIAHQVEVTSSISDYGRREFTLASPLIADIDYARDYTTFLSLQKKDPTTTTPVKIKNLWPSMLGWELGDAIHLTEIQTDTASVFNIMSMEHSLELARGVEHSVDLELEGRRDWEWLILDDAVYGVLDSRRLGF